MGKRMNYAVVAEKYSKHRRALPWKLEPLFEALTQLPVPARIIELGCGTADYLADLRGARPNHTYIGLDLSPEMLAEAKSRCPRAGLVVADVNQAFPLSTNSVDFVYLVDVLHHIEKTAQLFVECARILRDSGMLIVITDSKEDIFARTLGRLFPETIRINLERYPSIQYLVELAERAGFEIVSRKTVQGNIDFDNRFIVALEEKALSELRLISDEEHERGMAQTRNAQVRGDKWLSQTTVIEWIKS